MIDCDPGFRLLSKDIDGTSLLFRGRKIDE